MFKNVIKKFKGLFKKGKSSGPIKKSKPSVVNANINVSKTNIKYNDNEREQSSVISLKPSTDMICANCKKEITNDNYESSLSKDGKYYYSRCSCGFVNKIVDKKSYAPDISEMRQAHKLFVDNEAIFCMYSTAEYGEKKAL